MIPVLDQPGPTPAPVRGGASADGRRAEGATDGPEFSAVLSNVEGRDERTTRSGDDPASAHDDAAEGESTGDGRGGRTRSDAHPVASGQLIELALLGGRTPSISHDAPTDAASPLGVEPPANVQLGPAATVAPPGPVTDVVAADSPSPGLVAGDPVPTVPSELGGSIEAPTVPTSSPVTPTPTIETPAATTKPTAGEVVDVTTDIAATSTREVAAAAPAVSEDDVTQVDGTAETPTESPTAARLGAEQLPTESPGAAEDADVEPSTVIRPAPGAAASRSPVSSETPMPDAAPTQDAPPAADTTAPTAARRPESGTTNSGTTNVAPTAPPTDAEAAVSAGPETPATPVEERPVSASESTVVRVSTTTSSDAADANPVDATPTEPAVRAESTEPVTATRPGTAATNAAARLAEHTAVRELMDQIERHRLTTSGSLEVEIQTDRFGAIRIEATDGGDGVQLSLRGDGASQQELADLARGLREQFGQGEVELDVEDRREPRDDGRGDRTVRPESDDPDPAASEDGLRLRGVDLHL